MFSNIYGWLKYINSMYMYIMYMSDNASDLCLMLLVFSCLLHNYAILILSVINSVCLELCGVYLEK